VILPEKLLQGGGDVGAYTERGGMLSGEKKNKEGGHYVGLSPKNEERR